jgi:hypothetical protein
MFNINEFKSRINRHGGPSRTSLFSVRFSPINVPNNILSTDDLRFFCQTIAMPGINLELMPYRQGGIGYPEYMPMTSSPDSLNGVFMLDSNHRVMTFFHSWINSVINVSGAAGPSSSGLEQKEIGYKENYTTTMEIDFYSAYDQFKFYRCTYSGVFPTQVGSLTLNWSDNDSIATLPVNFSYSKMIYSGFQNISFENSRLFTSQKESIPQNGILSQIIRSFDQRNIDAGAIEF